MDAAIPEIEIANDADAPRVGRPHSEMHAAHAFNLAHVRAQLFVFLIVRAFAEKMQVVLGQHGRERVWIGSLENISVAESNLQAIRPPEVRLRCSPSRRRLPECALQTGPRDVPGLRGVVQISCPKARSLPPLWAKNTDGQRLLSVLLRPVRPQSREGIRIFAAHNLREFIMQAIAGFLCGCLRFVFFAHNAQKIPCRSPAHHLTGAEAPRQIHLRADLIAPNLLDLIAETR